MMILYVCTRLADSDIKWADKVFKDLSLKKFPGKQISDMSTKALKYINIMDYYVHPSSHI